MSGPDASWQIGRRIAPPRFILFLGAFAAGLALAIPTLGWERGIMAAFDVAALIFFLSVIPLFRRDRAEQMRQASRRNDANRTFLLVITSITTLAVLVAVGISVQQERDPLAIGLVVATLIVSWTFSNLVYAFHYAHLYYRGAADGEGDARGLKFRDCDEPDYWDFLYFSNTLGMAFATSDTLIAAQSMRRIALGQTYAAFIFNLGVIAFAVGALGGG